ERPRRSGFLVDDGERCPVCEMRHEKLRDFAESRFIIERRRKNLGRLREIRCGFLGFFSRGDVLPLRCEPAVGKGIAVELRPPADSRIESFERYGLSTFGGASHLYLEQS